MHTRTLACENKMVPAQNAFCETILVCVCVCVWGGGGGGYPAIPIYVGEQWLQMTGVLVYKGLKS